MRRANDPLLKGSHHHLHHAPYDRGSSRRLRGRGTDAEDEIQRRMTVAVEEMTSKYYDHKIVSATAKKTSPLVSLQKHSLASSNARSIR